jgi:hypothetical protein
MKYSNTIKITWNIIRTESGKQVNAKNFKTSKIYPNVFNNYFLTIAKNIHNIPTQITLDNNNINYKCYLNLTAKSPSSQNNI